MKYIFDSTSNQFTYFYLTFFIGVGKICLSLGSTLTTVMPTLYDICEEVWIGFYGIK